MSDLVPLVGAGAANGMAVPDEEAGRRSFNVHLIFWASHGPMCVETCAGSAASTVAQGGATRASFCGELS